MREGVARQRGVALIAALTAVVLVSACTGSEADPETFPEDGPAWVVLTTGAGFTEAGADDVPDGWVPLLVHEDGCNLAGRGLQVDEPVQDSRTGSIAELGELKDAAGVDAHTDVEEDFIVSGGVGESDDVTLPFVMTSGTDNGEEVRLAARTGVRVHHDGEMTTDVLHLRFGCPDSIAEDLWDDVREGLRADISAAGATEADPWGTASAP